MNSPLGHYGHLLRGFARAGSPESTNRVEGKARLDGGTRIGSIVGLILLYPLLDVR